MLTILPCSHRLAADQHTLGPAQGNRRIFFFLFFFFIIEGFGVSGFNKLCSEIKWMCCDMRAGTWDFPPYTDFSRIVWVWFPKCFTLGSFHLLADGQRPRAKVHLRGFSFKMCHIFSGIQEKLKNRSSNFFYNYHYWRWEPNCAQT